MKKVKLLLIIPLLGISVITSCSKRTDSYINVSVNIPLTGDLSTYGNAIKNGVMLFQEDSQDQKNDNRTKIKYDWQDNAGQTKYAVSVLNKQLLTPIDIYISGVKPQTMAIIDQISLKQIPHFVWIFDAFVCQNYKNTFRTWVSYKYEPELYLDYAKKIKPKRVSIIYANLPHAEEEFQKIVIPRLNNLGINDVMTEAYDWTKKDFKDISVKVKGYNPDLIILNGFKSTIIGLIQSLRSLNLITDGNTIVTYDMLDAAEELSPELIEGIRVIAPIFNTKQDDQTLIDWKNKFERKYNKKPLYTDAYAYDMAHIIDDAYTRLKFPASKVEWTKAILETNITGITGPLSFDEDGDLKISIEISVYRNGILVTD